MASTQTTRTTVSSRIRQQLLERITRGELAPGSRLPPERTLSDEFEAARTSVREAIQGLVQLGVVERRGNRTWVADHLPDLLVYDSLDVARFARNLCEARRALEVPISSLAASRADAAARDKVERLLAEFDPSMSIADFRRLDREFHAAISAACGNPLLLEMHRRVLDELYRSPAFEALLAEPHDDEPLESILAEGIACHQRIGQAFLDGDTAATEAAVHEHIDSVERRTSRQYGRPA